MSRNLRQLAYGIAGAALLLAFIAAPSAWVTPGSVALAQTVPNSTPTGGPATETAEPPPATVLPAATPAGGATALPGSTPVVPGSGAGANSLCASSTSLTLVGNPTTVVPGTTVVFTATLTNTSREVLKQLLLQNELSAGLEPLRVLAGQGVWQNRILSLAAPTLGPGASLVAVYSAKVSPGAPAVVTARFSATTGGCPSKTALVTLALPPTELPRTGGSLD